MEGSEWCNEQTEGEGKEVESNKGAAERRGKRTEYEGKNNERKEGKENTDDGKGVNKGNAKCGSEKEVYRKECSDVRRGK